MGNNPENREQHSVGSTIDLIKGLVDDQIYGAQLKLPFDEVAADFNNQEFDSAVVMRDNEGSYWHIKRCYEYHKNGEQNTFYVFTRLLPHEKNGNKEFYQTLTTVFIDNQKDSIFCNYRKPVTCGRSNIDPVTNEKWADFDKVNSFYKLFADNTNDNSGRAGIVDSNNATKLVKMHIHECSFLYGDSVNTELKAVIGYKSFFSKIVAYVLSRGSYSP